MNLEISVAEHYIAGSLLEAILNGIKRAGKTVDSIQLDDLAPLDEFHIGGREATRHFLGQMEFKPDMQVLDIGCGLGGAARFLLMSSIPSSNVIFSGSVSRGREALNFPSVR